MRLHLPFFLHLAPLQEEKGCTVTLNFLQKSLAELLCFSLPVVCPAHIETLIESCLPKNRSQRAAEQPWAAAAVCHRTALHQALRFP